MAIKISHLLVKGLPEYLGVLHERKIKHFRHYNIPYKRILAQFDICLLKQHNGYKGVLLLIDCKTRKLWFSLLKTKTKKDVENGLEKIIKQTGSFEHASSDGELRFTAQWWKSKDIYYNALVKNVHPAFVESAQRSFKQRYTIH